MASSPELVQYIADQLSPCGTITFKKMFGEYGLYLNGKMFASVCDDTLFVKPTKAGRARSGLPAGPALSRRKRLPAHRKRG